MLALGLSIFCEWFFFPIFSVPLGSNLLQAAHTEQHGLNHRWADGLCVWMSKKASSSGSNAPLNFKILFH